MGGDYYASKVVVVTGAGGGIGRALALQLARRGARLALWDSDATALGDTAQACRRQGATVRVDVVDVRDAEQLTASAVAAADELGGPDVVVCLAGVIHTGRFLDSSPEDYRHVMEVNFWGMVNTVRACLPPMIASGGGGS